MEYVYDRLVNKFSLREARYYDLVSNKMHLILKIILDNILQYKDIIEKRR